MKRFVFFGLLIALMSLLTACPIDPVQVKSVAGPYEGFIGELSDGTARIPLSVTLGQQEEELSGTAVLVKTPHQILESLDGITSGQSVIFFGSFFSESGEATNYYFTGELDGNTVRGSVEITVYEKPEGTSPKVSGTFEMSRVR